jgi:hypothetical protein
VKRAREEERGHDHQVVEPDILAVALVDLESDGASQWPCVGGAIASHGQP